MLISMFPVRTMKLKEVRKEICFQEKRTRPYHPCSSPVVTDPKVLQRQDVHIKPDFPASVAAGGGQVMKEHPVS